MNLKIVNEIKLLGFWHGAILYACFDSLYQDFIGKQAYLALVQKNWTDSLITVPIAIGLIAFIIIDIILKARKIIKQNAKKIYGDTDF